MALVKGTNCGFVTVAPVDDPAASNLVNDNYARAFKDVAPAGAAKVTEIGWWCDDASEASDYDVGIYSHDAVNNRPDVLIGSALNNAKGLASGWKVVSGLNITITPGITYWIGVQLDDTPSQTNTNYASFSDQKMDFKSYQTSLPSPWVSSDGSRVYLVAFYAVYETGGGDQTVLDYERKTRGVNRGVCRGAA